MKKATMRSAIGYALLGAALLPFLMGGCGGGDDAPARSETVVRKAVPDRPSEVVKPVPSPPPEPPAGDEVPSGDEAPAVAATEPAIPEPAAPEPPPAEVPEPPAPEETPPAEPKPPVVADADTPPPATGPTPSEAPEKETPAPAMDDEPEPVDDAVPAVADAPADEPEPVPAEEYPSDAPSEGEAAIAATPTEEEMAEAEADVMGDSAIASIINMGRQQDDGGEYDPSGRVNPFEPLFKPEPPPKEEPEEPPPEPKTAGDKPEPKRRVPRTPLERMDLGQLKLVGIIRAESGDRALVEEASGKGYIIKEGTYIGIHSGQVAEILWDRIIVEEKTEDVYGEATYRTRELKLQKPPGEGYDQM